MKSDDLFGSVDDDIFRNPKRFSLVDSFYDSLNDEYRRALGLIYMSPGESILDEYRHALELMKGEDRSMQEEYRSIFGLDAPKKKPFPFIIEPSMMSQKSLLETYYPDPKLGFHLIIEPSMMSQKSLLETYYPDPKPEVYSILRYSNLVDILNSWDTPIFSPKLHDKPCRRNPEVALVRDRLDQWRSYHEHNTASMPGPAYFPTDKVADAIYRSRKPLLSISLPDPRLDLDISDEAVEGALLRAKLGDKYPF